MPAILFGSIGTLADTSELQRAAFNDAFAAHGLGWQWNQPEYQDLLQNSGGEARIAQYASDSGIDVDAGAVHATKSQNFQESLREGGIRVRSGVAETIAAAREAGIKVALVTTTSAENLAALKEALSPSVDLDGFDLILDRSDVSEPKPDAEIYRLALSRLEEPADEVVAIEDNVGGVSAARAAGLRTIAFPGENNAGHDFSQATDRVEQLEPTQVIGLSLQS